VQTCRRPRAAAARAIELARRLDDQETLTHALTNFGSARLLAGQLTLSIPEPTARQSLLLSLALVDRSPSCWSVADIGAAEGSVRYRR
jgi:hypothetical protein